MSTNTAQNTGHGVLVSELIKRGERLRLGAGVILPQDHDRAEAMASRALRGLASHGIRPDAPDWEGHGAASAADYRARWSPAVPESVTLSALASHSAQAFAWRIWTEAARVCSPADVEEFACIYRASYAEAFATSGALPLHPLRRSGNGLRFGALRTWYNARRAASNRCRSLLYGGGAERVRIIALDALPPAVASGMVGEDPGDGATWRRLGRGVRWHVSARELQHAHDCLAVYWKAGGSRKAASGLEGDSSLLSALSSMASGRGMLELVKAGATLGDGHSVEDSLRKRVSRLREHIASGDVLMTKQPSLAESILGSPSVASACFATPSAPTVTTTAPARELWTPCAAEVESGAFIVLPGWSARGMETLAARFGCRLLLPGRLASQTRSPLDMARAIHADRAQGMARARIATMRARIATQRANHYAPASQSAMAGRLRADAAHAVRLSRAGAWDTARQLALSTAQAARAIGETTLADQSDRADMVARWHHWRALSRIARHGRRANGERVTFDDRAKARLRLLNELRDHGRASIAARIAPTMDDVRAMSGPGGTLVPLPR